MLLILLLIWPAIIAYQQSELYAQAKNALSAADLATRGSFLSRAASFFRRQSKTVYPKPPILVSPQSQSNSLYTIIPLPKSYRPQKPIRLFWLNVHVAF